MSRKEAGRPIRLLQKCRWEKIVAWTHGDGPSGKILDIFFILKLAGLAERFDMRCEKNRGVGNES